MFQKEELVKVFKDNMFLTKATIKNVVKQGDLIHLRDTEEHKFPAFNLQGISKHDHMGHFTFTYSDWWA
jgi:hypothetical protein